MTKLLCTPCGQPTSDFSGIDVAGLTRTETLILEALISGRHRFTPMSALVDAVYGNRPDGGPLDPSKIIRVVISRMRPRLFTLGWTVELRWGGIAYIEVDGTPLHRDEIEAFAVSDGFDPTRLAGIAPAKLIGATARETMGRFWAAENPGSIFQGVIIRWEARP